MTPQDIDFQKMKKQLMNHKSNLTSQEYHEWQNWIDELMDDSGAIEQQEEYGEDIMQRFQHIPYRNPSLQLTYGDTMKMIQGAHLNTEDLHDLSAEQVLRSWMPLFEPAPQVDVSRHPTMESRFFANGTNRMKRSLNASEAVEACAPPNSDPESVVSSEERMVQAPIQIGGSRNRRYLKGDISADLKLHDMILLLRPHAERSRKQPFWMAQIAAWNFQDGQAFIQWFSAVDESLPWQDCIWGELMNIFTQEMYDNLPQNQRGKGG